MSSREMRRRNKGEEEEEDEEEGKVEADNEAEE